MSIGYASQRHSILRPQADYPTWILYSTSRFQFLVLRQTLCTYFLTPLPSHLSLLLLHLPLRSFPLPLLSFPLPLLSLPIPRLLFLRFVVSFDRPK